VEPPLSEEEYRMLKLFVAGRTIKEIAAELAISPETGASARAEHPNGVGRSRPTGVGEEAGVTWPGHPALAPNGRPFPGRCNRGQEGDSMHPQRP
jgi:hypothetical protein